jgi:hypothetical protein
MKILLDRRDTWFWKFNAPFGTGRYGWYKKQNAKIDASKCPPLPTVDVERFIKEYKECIFNPASNRWKPEREDFLKKLAPSIVYGFENRSNISISWRCMGGKAADTVRNELIHHKLIVTKSGNNITNEESKFRVSQDLYNMVRPLARIGYVPDDQAKKKNPKKKYRHIDGCEDIEEKLLLYNRFMAKHKVLADGRSTSYQLCRHYSQDKDKVIPSRLYQMMDTLDVYIANQKSEKRADILIDGEAVCSLDITASHPQIIYCRNTSKSMKYEPYIGEKGSCKYKLSKLAFMMLINNDKPSAAQKAFNGLFIPPQKNASSEDKKKYKSNKSLVAYKTKNGITFKGLHNQLKEGNPDIINDDMPSCYVLLGIEGDIGLRVHLKLVELGIPSLNMFDEFIVPKSNINDLQRVFIEAFREIFPACEPRYRIDGVAYQGFDKLAKEQASVSENVSADDWKLLGEMYAEQAYAEEQAYMEAEYERQLDMGD